MALVTGTDVMETVELDEAVVQARQAEVRVDGALRRVQGYIFLGIFGVLMFALGNYMGMGMNFGYVP